MASPFTVQFGAWAPDLQNVATETAQQLIDTGVPLADCLNIYYQDAAYRSMPGPNPSGPALSSQCLAAFPWYDNTTGQQILFAATSEGIFALSEGSWSQLGVENALSIPATAWASLRTTWGSAQQVFPWKLALKLGTITPLGTIFTGSMTAGQTGSPPTGQTTGYTTGLIGSITPLADKNGHTIRSLYTYLYQPFHSSPTYSALFAINGTVAATYISQINVGSSVLGAPAATFSTSGGVSQWVWSGPVMTVTNGVKYAVTIFP